MGLVLSPALPHVAAVVFLLFVFFFWPVGISGYLPSALMRPQVRPRRTNRAAEVMPPEADWGGWWLRLWAKQGRPLHDLLDDLLTPSTDF